MNACSTSSLASISACLARSRRVEAFSKIRVASSRCLATGKSFVFSSTSFLRSASYSLRTFSPRAPVKLLANFRFSLISFSSSSMTFLVRSGAGAGASAAGSGGAPVRGGVRDRCRAGGLLSLSAFLASSSSFFFCSSFSFFSFCFGFAFAMAAS